MKSRVTFEVRDSIPVQLPVQYPEINARAELENSSLSAITVEIDHNEEASPNEIMEAARQKIRDVATLIGVGRGIEPAYGTVRIRQLPEDTEKPTIGLLDVHTTAAIARGLISLPNPELVTRLAADPKLRRQAECLNTACNAPDTVSQIRWAYQILEQEKERKMGYKPPDNFRHIRDAVSHPELSNPAAKAFLKNSPISTEALDLRDPKHCEFLAQQAAKLVAEAERIVKDALSDRKFWA